MRRYINNKKETINIHLPFLSVCVWHRTIDAHFFLFDGKRAGNTPNSPSFVFSFNAIEIDERSKAINIIVSAMSNPYFGMDTVMVCVHVWFLFHDGMTINRLWEQYVEFSFLLSNL